MEDIKDTGQLVFEKQGQTALHEDVELHVGQARSRSCLKRFRWVLVTAAVFLVTLLWHGLDEQITTSLTEGSLDKTWSSFVGEDRPHRGRRRFLNGKAAERIFLYVSKCLS